METMLASLIVGQQEMVKHFDGCLEEAKGQACSQSRRDYFRMQIPQGSAYVDGGPTLLMWEGKSKMEG